MERQNYIDRLMLLSSLDFNYLNIDAIFSDETENYREPAVPKVGKKITIKIRVGKDNVDEVYIVTQNSTIKMSKISTKGRVDFYGGSFKIENSEPLNYYFRIEKDNRHYYYNKQGITKEVNTDFSFIIIPEFETPDWAKGAVMYQIYVDRFYNGDKTNDVVDNEYAYLGVTSKQVKDWNSPVENLDVCNFYGGDLQGVLDKMDYLSELGIDVIYFNPVFVSPSNHKYDIQDYDNIDPHYGVIVKDGGNPLPKDCKDNTEATMYMIRTTEKENLDKSNALFAKLVEIAHSKGIKIILDGVFNHCGAFNKWLDREGFYYRNGYPYGAYQAEQSKYHNFFKWHGGHWPGNESYDGWWAHSNHPKLNYENSKELYEYIINVGKKWVSAPYNADGWRLDVAADLGSSKEFNMQFWRNFRKAVKEANPDAIILAEHYGDPKDWLMGDQWDTVMNYDAFMEPITWFLTGMEKHSEQYNQNKYNNAADFEASMRYFTSRFSNQSLMVSMNELSNHDHSRFLTRTNKKSGRLCNMGAEEADTDVNIAVMREAITFQMTWVGAPTIYYGDEVGMTGWTDPDNRRPFPWGNENTDILEFYKKLISIHKSSSAFSTGSTDYLYMDYGIICYGRWNKKDKFVVILNNNEAEKEIAVPVWRLDVDDNTIMSVIVKSDYNSWIIGGGSYIVRNGCFRIKVRGYGCCVIKNS